jgi:DNA-binding beta-propeller fold protein YncE
VGFREKYRVSGNLAKTCREMDVSENTARKWQKKGLLNFDNEELQLQTVMAIGPDKITAIIDAASENLFLAQNRVKQMIHEAPAGTASRIAVEQFNIMRVAEGQATSITEFIGADDVAAKLNQLLHREEDVIDAEAVEVV